jgi:hypothetical protein
MFDFFVTAWSPLPVHRLLSSVDWAHSGSIILDTGSEFNLRLSVHSGNNVCILYPVNNTRKTMYLEE